MIFFQLIDRVGLGDLWKMNTAITSDNNFIKQDLFVYYQENFTKLNFFSIK